MVYRGPVSTPVHSTYRSIESFVRTYSAQPLFRIWETCSVVGSDPVILRRNFIRDGRGLSGLRIGERSIMCRHKSIEVQRNRRGGFLSREVIYHRIGLRSIPTAFCFTGCCRLFWRNIVPSTKRSEFRLLDDKIRISQRRPVLSILLPVLFLAVHSLIYGSFLLSSGECE